jgi:hypothetical protein
VPPLRYSSALLLPRLSIPGENHPAKPLICLASTQRAQQSLTMTLTIGGVKLTKDFHSVPLIVTANVDNEDVSPHLSRSALPGR